MPRINLVVPFGEIATVENVGAVWDAVQKCWFVPAGGDHARFLRWIPKVSRANFISPLYFVAVSSQKCWKCKRPSKVVTVVLPPGWNRIQPEDDELEYRGTPVMLSSVDFLAVDVVLSVQGFCSGYFKDFSKMAGRSYWMNHCEHCEAKFGDFFLCGDVGGAMVLSDEMPRIPLFKIESEFYGHGSCGIGFDLESGLETPGSNRLMAWS